MWKRLVNVRRDWPLVVWGLSFGIGLDIADSMRQVWETITVVVAVFAVSSPLFFWAVRRTQRRSSGHGTSGRECAGSCVQDRGKQ